jgi:hypothetical protein
VKEVNRTDSIGYSCSVNGKDPKGRRGQRALARRNSPNLCISTKLDTYLYLAVASVLERQCVLGFIIEKG